jgi:hypothetical protein
MLVKPGSGLFLLIISVILSAILLNIDVIDYERSKGKEEEE